MAKTPEEWLLQADYDMDTAQYLLEGGRRSYAMYMCHLALEKALKGLYHSTINSIPPKTHSLIGLVKNLNLQLPEDMGRFLLKLNELCVTTRYPEDLSRMQALFNNEFVDQAIKKGRTILQWIKTQF